MVHLHIDASNGIAGDMLFSALLDSGADLEAISRDLHKLPLEDFSLDTERVVRSGVSGLLLLIDTIASDQVKSHCTKHKHGPARCLPDIIKLFDNREIPDKISEKAIAVFTRLAAAESKIHSKPVEKIHFHEISGLDTIIDIVGCCLALWQLKVESISCSTISVGTGFVNCAHGKMPLPAPATAELLKDIPFRQINTGTEICTPTGAALAGELSDTFGICPSMEIKSIGYGAGNKEIKNQANIVRVFLGEIQKPENNSSRKDQVFQLTCAIDDLTGEKAAFAVEQIFKAGAIDAYLKPVIMKKNRPGLELTVLTDEKSKSKIIELIFTFTKTFGLREEIINRKILKREIRSTVIDNENIAVKIGFLDNKAIVFSAEYEDCRKAALKNNKDLDYYYNKAEFYFRDLFEKGLENE
ncbi:MAG: nickel pincer cofactor biosynthesis protein LarC [Planctomycetota bacterium]|jgi:uncharacterized protein (TIGR00299 family) protein